MTTSITNIERRGGPKCGYTFLVSIACDAELGGERDKWTVTALLGPADLASYAAFRRGVLKRGGLLFADDVYEGRRGALLWSSDIQSLLSAAIAKEGAA